MVARPRLSRPWAIALSCALTTAVVPLVASDPGHAQTEPLSITVKRTSDANGDGVFMASETASVPGATVPFRIRVENATDIAVTITSVVDSKGGTVCDGALGTDITGAPQGTLAPVGDSGNRDEVSCDFSLPGYAPAPGESRQDSVTVTVEATVPGGPLDPNVTYLVGDDGFIDNKSAAYLDEAGTARTFSSADVNDNHSGIPERSPLDFFVANVGKTITLPTGQDSDRGIFAITSAPASWAAAGPTTNGLRNFFGDPATDTNGHDVVDKADDRPPPHKVGPRLGTGSDPEKLLDGIPALAYGKTDLQGLAGRKVCLLIKDSDVSFDQGKKTAKFQGEYLGVIGGEIVAVVDPAPATIGGSSSSLPALRIRVLDPSTTCGAPPQTVRAGSGTDSSLVITAAGAMNITKIVQGVGDADFDFAFDPEGDGPPQAFTLRNGDTKLFGRLGVGTYKVTEGDETGFDLVDVDCAGATAAVDRAARTVTITVGVNETVNCRFTNAVKAIPPPTAEINVTKVVDGPGDAQFDFTFDPDGAPPAAPFGLENGETRPFEGLAPGTYTVTELASAGFDLVRIDCGDADAVIDPAAGTARITLGPGDIVNCTYTNRPEAAINVAKMVDGEGDGDFDFTFDPAGDPPAAPFVLKGGEIKSFEGLAPGTYTVTEGTETGFDLKAVDCGDATALTDLGDRTATITVSAGDVVRCTFVNTPEVVEPGRGLIVVRKVADALDTGTDFPFASDFDQNPADGVDFALEAGAEREFDLGPGTYSVSELVPRGWDLINVDCSDGSPATAITLSETETVVCTFRNKIDSVDEDPAPPVGDAGDPARPPNPPTEIAGKTEERPGGQPGIPAPPRGPTVENTAPREEALPAVLSQLPRTGANIRRMTLLGVLLVVAGRFAALAGLARAGRRRLMPVPLLTRRRSRTAGP